MKYVVREQFGAYKRGDVIDASDVDDETLLVRKCNRVEHDALEGPAASTVVGAPVPPAAGKE